MPVVRAATHRELLEKIAHFAVRQKVKISVVFDGAEEEFFRDGSSYKGIKIFYARKDSNADERIKKFVEAEKQKRALTVVTSDTALANYCRTCGAPVVRSNDFRRRIEDTEKENAADSRGEKIEPDELKNWMRYFGVDETDDL